MGYNKMYRMLFASVLCLGIANAAYKGYKSEQVNLPKLTKKITTYYGNWTGSLMLFDDKSAKLIFDIPIKGGKQGIIYSDFNGDGLVDKIEMFDKAPFRFEDSREIFVRERDYGNEKEAFSIGDNLLKREYRKL